MINTLVPVSWECFASASLPGHHQRKYTSRLILGATTEPQFVSTPEMDVQMRPVGYWGPVTATLDWCEVRHYSFTHLTSPLHSVFRPIISFLIMWPKCPTRSPIFSSSAYRYTVHVWHRGNPYPLAISLDLLFVFFFSARLSSNCNTLLCHLLNFFFEIFVGVCLGRAGKHFFPRDTPL
jgi:hypothetical protein